MMMLVHAILKKTIQGPTDFFSQLEQNFVALISL